MSENSKSVAIRHETGPTILLGSGGYFDYDAPEESKLTIEDYAYALAFTCRFAGQCVHPKSGKRIFYSVAQHCEILSHIVPAELAYGALMHESGEVVCGDLTSPLKSKLPEYKAIEKHCAAAIERQFMVSADGINALKQYDVRMWATEREQLLNWDGNRWGPGDDAAPFEIRIDPVGPHRAAKAFLNRFNKLAPAALKRSLASQR